MYSEDVTDFTDMQLVIEEDVINFTDMQPVIDEWSYWPMCFVQVIDKRNATKKSKNTTDYLKFVSTFFGWKS